MTIKTYWDKTGTHQATYNQLWKLIPSSGPVEKGRPALERLRKATNAYYDIFNNGGWNRRHSITSIFGSGTMNLVHNRRWDAVHSRIEPIMDQIIEAAHAEEWGAPCVDFDPECSACKAWLEFRAEHV